MLQQNMIQFVWYLHYSTIFYRCKVFEKKKFSFSLYPLKNTLQHAIMVAMEGGGIMAGIKGRSGKKNDQKMKPFLVYEYLMRETDSEHFKSTDDIKGYLQEKFGIAAERRSIYRDVHEINKVLLALQEDITLEEAEELLLEDEESKSIRHHKRRGFYVAQRNYEEEDIRLLAECVHSAKFVDERRAKKLADIVYQLVSVHQAEKTDRHAIVKNRVKTSNTAVFYTVNTINEAIGHGGTDTRTIKFHYLKHTLQNMGEQEKQRKGEYYLVTPYTIIIDDGNYYLLGFDEGKKKLLTFRVDRMINTKITSVYNTDPKKFADIDVEHYTQEHFGMFGGQLEHVTLNCSNRLLETMIDRFGVDGISYIPVKKTHFNIHVSVYISDQFFGWLSGFGKMIQITSPLSVRQQYAEYLQKISEWHSRPINEEL